MIERRLNPSALKGESPAHARTPAGVFVRPTAKTGLVGWLTTVDHKRIGILYGITALFFFLLGGVEALLIRLQLAVPNNDLLTAQQYPIVVFSGVAIGFLGFGVWSHHMFTTGMGAVATAAFALGSMAIAVPTGVKIFNWIGTLWGGSLRLRTPLLFALGFIWMFMMGGFSGVMHAAAPADAQQHDSYFVVAHIHYVLIGGSLFAMLAGIHYWFPLIRGRVIPERLGKIAFWIIFVGFNVTFFPLHFLGLNGMPRRTFTYDPNMGWSIPNFVATVGALILGAGLVFYFAVLVRSWRKGEVARCDPWDARTLEWKATLPPPEHNFDVIPRVHARDSWWHEKYDPPAKHGGDAADAAASSRPIHMPSQSWFPILTASAILLGGLFFANHHMPGAIAGGALTVLGIWFWSLEGPGGHYVHPTRDAQ